MGKSIVSIDPAAIASLLPAPGVELVRDLLWSEATRLKIPRHAVTISSDITVKDGGIDASISTTGPHDSILIAGHCHYQIKTGPSFAPWQEAEIRTELFGKNPSTAQHLGTAVLHCLRSGFVYSLVTLGTDLTTERQTRAVTHLKKFFTDCGFPDARVQVLGITQIISALMLHPALCLNLNGLGDLPFQRVASWATTADMTPALALGPNQEAFITDLQSTLDGSEFRHVRIIGEPGIGKSRLVLEAIQQQPELAANALYVRQASDILKNPLLTELLKGGREYSVLLIVDECDDADRSLIWSALKGRESIKLVTIDHGPETAGGPLMKTIEAPALESGQVETILATYLGSSVNLRRWAEWCGGSARVAHALGENLRSNPDDILRSPDTVPIWDRFISGYGTSREDEVSRVVLRHIALFEKFGARAPVDNEVAYIAALAAQVDPSITRAKFDSIVNYYRERRILQGDRTLRIVPPALRIYLWREWWDNYGASADINAMTTAMPASLYGWFMRLFIYAHNVDSARDLVKRLLDPRTGLFAEKAFLTSKSGSQFINVLAEADPAATLALLRATVLKWSDVDLQALEEARQNLAWASEKIAVWADHFRNAAKVLLRLSFGDKSSNTNNAEGILKGLFSSHGTTQIGFSERAIIANEWLSSANVNEAGMGLAACSAMLNNHGGVRILGVENQGMRPELQFWKPKLWAELIGPWRSVFESLHKARTTRDETWGAKVDRVLITAIESLAHANVLHDEILASLHVLTSRDENFETLTQLIVRLLHYPNPHAPATFSPKLEEFSAKLIGDTFASRLRRYVLLNIWEDDYDKGIESDDEKQSSIARKLRLSLAQEAVCDIDVLKASLPALFTSAGYRVDEFGFDVSTALGDDRLDEAVLAYAQSAPELPIPYFLSGYLRGVYGIDATRWEKLAQQLISSRERWVLFAVICSGMTQTVFDLLIEIDEAGGMDSSCLTVMGNSAPQWSIGFDNVRQVLSVLLARDGADSYASAVTLAERHLCKSDPPDGADEPLVLKILMHDAASSGAGHRMVEYHWHELAKRFRRQFPQRDLELLGFMVSSASPFHGIAAGGNATQIASEICASNPSAAWEIVRSQLLGDSGWIFRNWLGDTGTPSSGHSQALLSFDFRDVFAWIDVDPTERAPMMAETMPQTFEQGEVGGITGAYVEKYGHLEHVSDSLRMRFHVGTFSGLRSENLKTKQANARRWIGQTTSTKIQDWLSDYIEALAAQIEEAEIWEERMF